MIILAVSAVINIFSSHLLAVINNISVWWHVAGAATVILILFFVPEQHASFSDVFAKTINNTGIFGGDQGWGWLLFVLPISAILTQYTITGYDASAHLSEETKSAANAAAKGIWQSIFYSAIGGWILLLSFLFAVQDADEVSEGGGAVATIFTQALDSQVGGDRAAHLDRGTVLLHHRLPDQRVANAVRVQPRPRRAGPSAVVEGELEEGSRQRRDRDRGHRGDHHAARVDHGEARRRWPGGAVAGRVLRGGVDRRRRPLPVLRGADLLPLEDRRRVCPGQLGICGRHWKWMAPVAIAEILVTSIIALFPYSNAGMPWDPNFEWKYVNYTPLLVGGTLLLLWVYWHLSVKKWFTGPVRQIEIEPEPEPA